MTIGNNLKNLVEYYWTRKFFFLFHPTSRWNPVHTLFRSQQHRISLNWWFFSSVSSSTFLRLVICKFQKIGWPFINISITELSIRVDWFEFLWRLFVFVPKRCSVNCPSMLMWPFYMYAQTNIGRMLELYILYIQRR